VDCRITGQDIHGFRFSTVFFYYLKDAPHLNCQLQIDSPRRETIEVSDIRANIWTGYKTWIEVVDNNVQDTLKIEDEQGTFITASPLGPFMRRIIFHVIPGYKILETMSLPT